MPLTPIKNYHKPHNAQGGGSGGDTYIVGNVSNSALPDVISVSGVNASNGEIDYLHGKSLTYNDGQFIYLASDNGVISKLSGDDLTYANGKISKLLSDNIETGKIKADEADITKAFIETLNSKNITTEYLTVTKQAHFFELVIDKIRSIGGTIIETAANCIVDYVKAYDTNNNEVALTANNVASWGIFWRATDGSGRAVTNDWLENDQAICQSFNNVSTGVNYDVSNKYYWMLVTGILQDRYMNINTGAETNSVAQSTRNAVTITNITVNEDQTLVNKFDIEAQTIPGIQTGASWDASTNTMTTTNTVFGIQLTPQAALDAVVPNKLTFTCSSARLSVGIYYVDATSQYFPAPENPTTTYDLTLDADNNIEAIVITNADEVQWHLVHGIRLSNTIKDTGLVGYSSIPSRGDHLSQLGYRYGPNASADDRSRASAIIIAAYKTPDTTITPPSYAQYRLINDFNLSSHKQTYFDANGAQFIGDFLINGTTTVQDYIDQNAPEYHMYTAYANSADGSVDFTKDPSYAANRTYMGICSSTDATDTNLTYSDYSWFAVTGAAGANAIQYKLMDVGSKATLSATLDNQNNMTQTLSFDLRYKVARIEGPNTRYATMAEMRDYPKVAGTNNGMYAYARYSSVTNEYDPAAYLYRRMTLDTSVNDTDDAYFSLTYTTTSDKVIADNKIVNVALILYNTQYLNPVSDTYNTYDETTLQVSMEPSATFQILQGQQASISSLVTGQQGQQSQISQLTQRADGIQSTVIGMQTDISELDGQYAGQQTQISQLTQRADSITSTVKNIHELDTNYFNFKQCEFENCVPYIQGYGVECTNGTLNRIYNLGFDGIRGDYSVTCYLRMQSSATDVLIDLNDVTQQTISNVTASEWKFVELTFNIDNAHMYTTLQQIGHIDFVSSSISDANRLYVRNLMVTRGPIPSGFAPSWKDYDTAEAQEGIPILSQDDWTYHNYVVKTQDTYKGYDVYQFQRTRTTELDLIYLNNVNLEANTIYTLTFYVLGDGRSYLYGTGNTVNGSITDGTGAFIMPQATEYSYTYSYGRCSIGNAPDGYTRWNGGDYDNSSFQKITIYWYNGSNTTRNIIALRIPGRTIPYNIYIAGIELRKGYWNDDLIDTASMIQQTATDITLKVKDTGINIEDGTITLSADNTIINGQLELHQGPQGAQGLTFINSNDENGLNLSTNTIPSLSVFQNQYPGYTHLDIGTNGFGFQSNSRYAYVTTDAIAIDDGSAGGVNDELHINMKLAQSGGNAGNIMDYIGGVEFGDDSNNTASVKFMQEYTSIQHNGVRYVRPSQNYDYSRCQVNSKDMILLCDPNGILANTSTQSNKAVTLNFAANCAGHCYFIKRMQDQGRIYIDGYVYTNEQNMSNTPVNNFYIDDNHLWMIIVVTNLNTIDGNKPNFILLANRIGA